MKQKIFLIAFAVCFSLLGASKASAQVKQGHPFHRLEQIFVDYPEYFPQYDFLRADDPNRLFNICYADHGTELRTLLDLIIEFVAEAEVHIALSKRMGLKPARLIVDRCEFWMKYFNDPVDPTQSPIARDFSGSIAHWPSWPDPSRPYPFSEGRIKWCNANHDGATQAQSDIRRDLDYARAKNKVLLSPSRYSVTVKKLK